MERDSQRQELNRIQVDMADTRSELDAQRETLSKLTTEVSTLEQHLNQVYHSDSQRKDTCIYMYIL